MFLKVKNIEFHHHQEKTKILGLISPFRFVRSENMTKKGNFRKLHFDINLDLVRNDKSKWMPKKVPHKLAVAAY